MIRITTEIREDTLAYRVCVAAPSIERAPEIAGDGKPGRRIGLVFPIDLEVFFVPENSDQTEAA